MRILHARTGEQIALLLPDFRPSLLPPQNVNKIIFLPLNCFKIPYKITAKLLCCIFQFYFYFLFLFGVMPPHWECTNGEGSNWVELLYTPFAKLLSLVQILWNLACTVQHNSSRTELLKSGNCKNLVLKSTLGVRSSTGIFLPWTVDLHILAIFHLYKYI